MSNAFSNRVSAALTDTTIADIKTAIESIKTFMPFLVGLTVEERMTIPKISEANRIFTSDALVSAANNAGMLPAYFATAELKTDFELYTALDEINLLLAQLSERVNDTQMLAGSEAYISALTAYRLFGAAANAGVPGADAVFDTLKARFKDQGGNSTTEVTPTLPVS